MKNMELKKDESDEYEMVIVYFKINYYTYCMFTNDMQNKYSFLIKMNKGLRGITLNK